MVFENVSFLDFTVFGNTGAQYAYALTVFVLGVLVLWFFKAIVLVFLKELSNRTKTEWDDLIIASIGRIRLPFFVFMAFYYAITFIKVPQIITSILEYAILIVIMFYAVLMLETVIDKVKNRMIESRKKEEKVDDTAIVDAAAGLVKIVLWIIAALVLLAHYGFNITTLLAGLGIGGLAVALAAQNILSDLFATFTIYLDKPFKKGDFIVIGTDMGVIKKIGLKSTRLETLQGQELVVSNRELTSTRINNFKKMQRRRIVATIGVTYNTPVKKLQKIPSIVSEIINKHARITLDRVHFKSFGDSSLVYEIVYYVESPEYNDYMDLQQQINLELAKRFEKEKIDFAYPTQTVYLKK